jgi:hypothetical protein
LINGKKRQNPTITNLKGALFFFKCIAVLPQSQVVGVLHLG